MSVPRAAGRLAAVLALLSLPAAAGAQLDLPRTSQRASVTQRIGYADVTVAYHRPGVKGRILWGSLVPWNEVWRAGANEATTFETSEPLRVEGEPLPAGRYALFAIPAPEEWILVFNAVAEQWGAFGYDESQDVLRVAVKPEPAPEREWLLYTFDDPATESATLSLRWGTLRVPIRLETDAVERAVAEARAAIEAAEDDDWGTPFQAADFCLHNRVHLEEALVWVDRSLAVERNYLNLSVKARFLAELGRRESALEAAAQAIESGKTGERRFDTRPLERRVAEWREEGGE